MMKAFIYFFATSFGIIAFMPNIKLNYTVEFDDKLNHIDTHNLNHAIANLVLDGFNHSNISTQHLEEIFLKWADDDNMWCSMTTTEIVNISPLIGSMGIEILGRKLSNVRRLYILHKMHKIVAIYNGKYKCKINLIGRHYEKMIMPISLESIGITDNKSWREWVRKNHPDKNPANSELFKTVSSMYNERK